MNATLLRRALLGDAIFEAVCAVIFIMGAGALATWTGWNAPLLFVIAGIILAGVAALLYWMTRQPQINLRLARTVMILNVLFAIGATVAQIAFASLLTDGARWLIGIIGGLVGVFAALEYIGLRFADAAR